MRFALFGDHPDGWRLVEALRATGRHQLVVWAAPKQTAGKNPNVGDIPVVTDIEEVLANPDVDAVIVASPTDDRLNHLRRVLQSERSAFCVHPVDVRPDGTYEIHMLQGDVHQVVIPILPECFSSAIDAVQQAISNCSPPGVLDVQVLRTGNALIPEGKEESPATFPGWTILRRIGGEIVEVGAFAEKEDLQPEDPALGFGRFQNGRLFQVNWLSRQATDDFRFQVRGLDPTTKITVPDDSASWQKLIERFESAIDRLKSAPRVPPGSGPALDLRDGLGWHDEIRAAELNDLARRSIERRRAYTLDFQEATEEIGFKGTMTLVGCALLWMLPVVAILFAWVPKLAWIVLAVLLVFLAMQLLKGRKQSP